jgi:hypothetical protein
MLDLERDLELARQHGRWLSDDEHRTLEQQRLHQRKLLILLGVCVLLPPLWPLALALTLFLLFPETSRRLAVGVGVGVAVVGIGATLLIAAVLVALLMAIF